MTNGMQNKTIRKILRNKLAEWIDSIHDIELRKMIMRDAIVTGGSIASMIMGDRINDFDIYFKTKDTTKAVAQYYIDLFEELNGKSYDMKVLEHESQNILGENETRISVFVSSAGVKEETGLVSNIDSDYSDEGDSTDINASADIETKNVDNNSLPRYRPVFISENAITLSNKVQLIVRFYGEPDQIHRNFDFDHAKCYYRYYENELVTPIEALRSMQSKTLIYRGSLYPVCSIFRCRKFIERGWKISAGQMLKMAIQISQIDLTDPVVLRDQLVGVDLLYFHMLISALKSVNEDKYEPQYIIEVIDRIFSTN